MNIEFPMHRAFVGIPLENEAKHRYQALQEELKEYEDILRFQDAEQPHLTLQFWSEVMEIEWQPIIEACERIAQATDPFSIKITVAGTFSHRGNDSVLFLDIAFSDELARLRKACPWVDAKPFAPHLTIARIKHPQRFAVKKKEIMKRLKNASFDIPIDRLRLYAEVDGVKQTPIHDFAFGSPHAMDNE